MGRSQDNALPVIFVSVCILIIILVCIFYIYHSLSKSVVIPTQHLDGAFQTASGLFRLDSGQLPGRDFYPYIGMGPILSLFPVFKLAGSNISSTVFASHFMTLVYGTINVSILVHLLWRQKSFIVSLTIGALLFALPLVAVKMFSFNLYQAIGITYSPGNSLRPIRASITYLAGIYLYILVVHIRGKYSKNILGGIGCGVIAMWSNDYAITTGALFTIVILYINYKNRNAFLSNLYYLISLTSTIFIINAAITDFSYLSLLRYNYFDVAQNQWWYFAPYGVNERIFDLIHLHKLLDEGVVLPVLVLLIAAIFAYLKNSLSYGMACFIGVCLFAGGAAASIGGHLGGYFKAFEYWAIILVAIMSMKFVVMFAMVSNIKRVYMRSATMLAGVCISSYSVVYAHNELDDFINKAKSNQTLYYEPGLGGYISRKWQHYIEDSLRGDNKIIEEYWGIYSALSGSFNPWKVDSVIHALGNVKYDAAKTLTDVNTIITTKYSSSMLWQPWSVSHNFWLYDELFHKWAVDKVSPRTVLWRKNNEINEVVKIPCNVLDSSKSLELDTDESGYYRLRLIYSLKKKGRGLLMMQNNISFGGFMSVNPSATSIVLPVYINADTKTLKTKVIGFREAQIEIMSCEASRIEFNHVHVLPKPGMYEEFFYTNKGWNKGIMRNRAAFIMPNIPSVTRSFVKGERVQLGDGSIRKIIKTKQDTIYYVVFLEGQSLDLDKHGMPLNYKIYDTETAL